MAAVQRKLVHKQFNSPIGLYSDQNVQETVDRELRAFSNGTIGIDIGDARKQVNLANSSVLKMVEEEEFEKTHPGYKRVAWPPASDSAAVYPTASQTQPQAPYQSAHQPQSQPNQSHYSQPQQQYKQPQQQQQYQYQKPQYQSSQPQYQSPQPQYQSSQPQYQSPQPKPQNQQPTYPSYTSQPQQQTLGAGRHPTYPGRPSPSSTVSFAGGIARGNSPAYPSTQQSNQQYQAPVTTFKTLSPQPNAILSPQYPSTQQHPSSSPSYSTGWSHVRTPTPTQSGYIQNTSNPYQRQNSAPFGIDSSFGAYQNPNQYQPQTTQAFQPVNQQPASVQESYQTPIYQQSQSQNQFQQQQQQLPNYSQAQGQYTPYGRGLSVGVIQLRPEAPVSQKPSPIFTSQPAAASFRGGSNMRGDMKWPPTEYKIQAAAENEARRKLALGPLFRPRRVNKDYGPFFAKHALNSYYPGYKIPPGTQHVYGEY